MTNLAGTTDTSSLNVTWAEPSDANGLITEYRVTATDSSSNVINSTTLGSDARSYLLDGLQLNTMYTITVIASNSLGMGASSSIQITTSAGMYVQ